MSFIQYIKDTVVPQIVQSGCLGEGPKVLNINDLLGSRDEFMSSVKFLDLEIQVGEATQKIPLFCKFENEYTKEEKRENFQTHLQFFNEILVYKEIVSSYPKSVLSILPKFYFGDTCSPESPKTNVIILENLFSKGFEETRERLFLDFEHCSLVFKKLGEFHGASLQMKTDNPSMFGNKISKLYEAKWTDKHKEKQTYFYKETTRRGVVPLLENSEHVDILNAFLDRLTNVHGIVRDVLEVNEHNVLCHGDFCRNNMLFKYDSRGRPTDVRFYDLGTARCASPIIDISFFLFQNTTSDLRRKHFRDDLLKTYLDGVKEYAGSAAPTMEQLWKEFQKKAVYGYLLSSFFLPVMWQDDRGPEDISLEEKTKQILRMGGQEVTDILCDIVRDLLSWGCLEETHQH